MNKPQIPRCWKSEKAPIQPLAETKPQNINTPIKSTQKLTQRKTRARLKPHSTSTSIRTHFCCPCCSYTLSQSIALNPLPPPLIPLSCITNSHAQTVNTLMESEEENQRAIH